MNNQNENKNSLSAGGEGRGEVENWDVIYSYTRSQAMADGFQVEGSKVAQEAGITYPVFLTRAVYDNYVTVPAGVTGQDETGRLWDVVWLLRFAIRKHSRKPTSNIHHPLIACRLRSTCATPTHTPPASSNWSPCAAQWT